MNDKILLSFLSLYAVTSFMLIFLLRGQIQFYANVPMLSSNLLPPFIKSYDPVHSEEFSKPLYATNIFVNSSKKGITNLGPLIKSKINPHFEDEKGNGKQLILGLNQPIPKIIVHWSEYSKRPRLGITYGFKNFEGCRMSNCIFLPKSSPYASRADALIFSPYNLNVSIPYPPGKRDPNQIWLFVSREPPLNLRLNATALSGMNWTMTFRLDSDIPMLWGYIVPSYFKTFRDGPFVHPLGKHKIATNYSLIRMKSFRSGGRIAWLVSNCRTRSKRHLIAQELGKYIPVDVYGGCGDYKCTRNDPKACLVKFQRDYKFYLSFENNLCSEYITEKLYRSLSLDILPIVYGGGDYAKVLPSKGMKAFVNVLDYLDVKALARYLLYLDRNPRAYLAYFTWKKYYKVVTQNPWCHVCQKLHDSKSFHIPKWYGSIMTWYSRDHCIEKIRGNETLILTTVRKALGNKLGQKY